MRTKSKKYTEFVAVKLTSSDLDAFEDYLWRNRLKKAQVLRKLIRDLVNDQNSATA